MSSRILKGIIDPVMYTSLAFLKDPLTLYPISNKSKRLSVIMAGGYGYQNVGDEAQLAVAISHWKRLCPNVKITILSPNPDYSEKLHGEHSEPAPRVSLFDADKNGNYLNSNFLFRFRFRWVKLRMLILARLYSKGLPLIGAYPHEVNLLNLIAKADVLHLCGGGYLTGMTLSRLWDNMLLIGLADILGTPSLLSGQTVGIFKDKVSRRLAYWGLRKPALIYLRDGVGSMNDIHSLGIDGDHIKVTFDDALFCDMAHKKAIDECLQKNKVATSLPYIAVNVHYFQQKSAESRRIMRRIAEVCDHVASKHNAQIVFIPLHPSDSAAMGEAQRNITTESKIVDYNFDYRIAKGIISRADICLTMRHHVIIFAMGTGVPTIAIALDDYYIRKNLGALKLFNQERWLVDRESLFSPSFMEEMVDDCFNKIREQKTIISSYLEAMRKQDGEAIQRFLKEYM